MSLCYLMVSDFKHGHGEGGYDQRNLVFGIDYAQDLLQEGCTKEPFYDYDLEAFCEWAEVRMSEMKPPAPLPVLVKPKFPPIKEK